VADNVLISKLFFVRPCSDIDENELLVSLQRV